MSITYKAADHLINGKIAEADTLYRQLTLDDMTGLHYCLTVFAILLNSEDARYKIRTFPVVWFNAYNIRAFNWWWLYPILVFLDIKLLFPLPTKQQGLAIARLKYPTPFSWLADGN